MIDEDLEKEYMRSGHMACPGCGVAATMRLVLNRGAHHLMVFFIRLIQRCGSLSLDRE